MAVETTVAVMAEAVMVMVVVEIVAEATAAVMVEAINTIIDRAGYFHEADQKMVRFFFCPFANSMALAGFVLWEFRCAILSR